MELLEILCLALNDPGPQFQKPFCAPCHEFVAVRRQRGGNFFIGHAGVDQPNFEVGENASDPLIKTGLDRGQGAIG